MPFNAANLVRLLTVVGIIAGATAWLASDPKWPIEQPQDVIGLARPVSVATTVAVIFWFALSRWLWRSWLARGWLVLVPNLNGKWKGELISNWRDDDRGGDHPSLPVELRVRQTLTSIHCVHDTPGSSNDSLSPAFRSPPERSICSTCTQTSHAKSSIRARTSTTERAGWSIRPT